MDGTGYLQCDKWVRDQKAEQPGIGQFAALSPQHGVQNKSLGIGARYGNGKRLIRRLANAEVIGHAHRHEGRDVEMLVMSLANTSVGSYARRNGVAVPLAKRVVHLVDQRFERAMAVVAEIDTERVEGVAQYARHAEKTNGASIKLDTDCVQTTFDLSSQRPIIVTVIAGVICDNISAIA